MTSAFIQIIEGDSPPDGYSGRGSEEQHSWEARKGCKQFRERAFRAFRASHLDQTPEKRRANALRLGTARKTLIPQRHVRDVYTLCSLGLCRRPVVGV